MGVLTIEAPRTLSSALANAATKFAVGIDQIAEYDGKIILTLTGEFRKVCNASAFEGVRRTHWEEKTCLTTEDRIATVKRSRRQA